MGKRRQVNVPVTVHRLKINLSMAWQLVLAVDVPQARVLVLTYVLELMSFNESLLLRMLPLLERLVRVV